MVEFILVLFLMAMVLIVAALWNEKTNHLELPNYKGGRHWHFDFSAQWESILGDSSRWVTRKLLMAHKVSPSIPAPIDDDVHDVD